MWDHEVDLVCLGGGIGGLAGAIAGVEQGLDVLVADTTTPATPSGAAVATQRRVQSLRGWMQTEACDAETAEYFAGIAEWVPETAYFSHDVPVPTRVATAIAADTSEPFVGARLSDWAEQCLTSPYGMAYSNVFGAGQSTMRAADGGTLEVTPLGSLRWTHGLGAPALSAWMADAARDRGIEILAQTPLNRLVFDAGRVAGVVLDTATGRTAVRARRGVVVAPGEPDTAVTGSLPVDGETRQVCLIGRTASRFGRVEVLGSVTPDRMRPTCPATRRSLRIGLHGPRRMRSVLGHCGKVNPDPTFGK
jgi:hypothetical protein